MVSPTYTSVPDVRRLRRLPAGVEVRGDPPFVRESNPSRVLTRLAVDLEPVGVSVLTVSPMTGILTGPLLKVGVCNLVGFRCRSSTRVHTAGLDPKVVEIGEPNESEEGVGMGYIT